MGMLRNIFFTFIACTLLYSLFVFGISRTGKKFTGVQNLWQENMMHLQDYVYAENNYNDVVTGSSLATHILLKDNDSVAINLAITGGDPFIGLQAIKQSNKMPKRIFIESNFLLSKKQHDESYINTLFLPGFYQLRRLMPILREEYHPANFLGQVILDQYGKPIPPVNVNPGKKNDSAMVALKFKTALLENHLADLENYKETFLNNLNLLKDYVDFFKRKGVKMYFFEMPVDCSIANDQLSVYSRQWITEFAAKNNISQLPMPACETYATSDGFHLTPSSSIVYTRYFLAQIKNIQP